MSSFTPVTPPTSAMTRAALRDSLTRIKYVEGPFQTFPEVVMRALLTHVANDGVDDFSMKLWQNSDQGLYNHYGREAKFVDKQFGEDIDVSRFAYDNFTQNIGKQIVIAKVKNQDVTTKGDCDYCICFGPGGNPHRDARSVKQDRFNDGREWKTIQWGIWVPTHLRKTTWLLQKESAIVRAFIPGACTCADSETWTKEETVCRTVAFTVDFPHTYSSAKRTSISSNFCRW